MNQTSGRHIRLEEKEPRMTQDNGKTFKVQSLLSLLIIAIGAVLMAIKIVADSEPGLIPLVLVVGGLAWYIVARARRRAAATTTL
jgi:hypothetical protein